MSAPVGPVLLWGAAGHARVLRDALARLGGTVVALVDRAPVPPPWDGAPPVMAPDDVAHWVAHWCAAWSGPQPGFLVAVGGARGTDRLAIAARLSASGLAPLSLAHPAAIVEPSARIEPGAQVLAGAVVGAAATVGAQSIVNTRASLDHDCILGPGCHLAPGVTVCGETRIGAGVFVGAGAVLGPKIAIGDGAVIGAGAVVLRDVGAGARVWGNPARLRGEER